MNRAAGSRGCLSSSLASSGDVNHRAAGNVRTGPEKNP